jgi:hypothetical protein
VVALCAPSNKKGRLRAPWLFTGAARQRALRLADRLGLPLSFDFARQFKVKPCPSAIAYPGGIERVIERVCDRLINEPIRPRRADEFGVRRDFSKASKGFHTDNPKKSAQPSAMPAARKMIHSMKFSGMVYIS